MSLYDECGHTHLVVMATIAWWLPHVAMCDGMRMRTPPAVPCMVSHHCLHPTQYVRPQPQAPLLSADPPLFFHTTHTAIQRLHAADERLLWPLDSLPPLQVLDNTELGELQVFAACMACR